MKHQKTVEEYRNTIFILKDRLDQRQQEYFELEKQYSSANIYEESSFDWKLREKILEVELDQINKQERKYLKERAVNIYELYFAMLKLIKACDVLSVSKEMVFRGVDKKMMKVVESSDFQQHLRQVFKMPLNSAASIIKTIQTDNKIHLNRYLQLLQYFHLQKQVKVKTLTLRSINKLVQNLYKQKIKINNLWKQDHINAVQFAYQITKQLKQLTILQCITVYYQLNPTRKESMLRRQIVQELQNLVDEEAQKNKRESSSLNKKMLN